MNFIATAAKTCADHRAVLAEAQPTPRVLHQLRLQRELDLVGFVDIVP